MAFLEVDGGRIDADPGGDRGDDRRGREVEAATALGEGGDAAADHLGHAFTVVGPELAEDRGGARCGRREAGDALAARYDAIAVTASMPIYDPRFERSLQVGMVDPPIET